MWKSRAFLNLFFLFYRWISLYVLPCMPWGWWLTIILSIFRASKGLIRPQWAWNGPLGVTGYWWGSYLLSQSLSHPVPSSFPSYTPDQSLH
jgi:hypothetical protein